MSIEILGRKFLLLVKIEQWYKLLDLVKMYFSKPTTAIFAITLLVGIFYFWKVFRCKDLEKIWLYKGILWNLFIIIFLCLSIFNRNMGSVRELRLFFDPWFSGKNAFHESTILIALIDCFYFMPYGAIVYWQEWNSYGFLISEIIVFVTGLMIEVLQFVLIRGVASIEDVAAYFIGGTIGIIGTIMLKRARVIFK